MILRTLCGLTAKEISIAFSQTEETLSKRIFRAKEKIRSAKLRLEVPIGQALLTRVDAVLQIIYLLFNEGYKSSTDNAVIRKDLCGEALRLSAILVQSEACKLPKAHALLSLICFQSARFDARIDKYGKIILLEDQDRSLYNQRLIRLGYEHLKKASIGREVSEYHLEAAIASYYTVAPSFDQTNFQAIFYCYELLWQINPSPFIALNKAIALGHYKGAEYGIEALHEIKDLENNYVYHSALGDFYKKIGQNIQSKMCYDKAMIYVTLPAEKELLKAKMKF
jgi:RNA polymerase sigma-70 factor (ECF subfamily)